MPAANVLNVLVDVLSTCTAPKAVTAQLRMSALNMTQSTATPTRADWAMLIVTRMIRWAAQRGLFVELTIVENSINSVRLRASY